MTVTEIARQAGVSIGTVDRVLHNRGRVSAETKERIQAIIDETGYQPNPLARHLKINRKYLVGLLIPELEKESRYWSLIHAGLMKAVEELSAFSFQIGIFEFVRPDRASLSSAFARMADARCDAWILAPIMQEETLALLEGVPDAPPYAFIDSPLPGSRPLVTVAQDPWRGGYLAGRLMDLISRTDGPFAVMRPYTGAFNLNERARGFTDWFAHRPGVRVADVVCPETRMDEVADILERTFAEYPGLRGIFTVSAFGHKIAEIIHRKGWKDRVSVVGYDLVSENERFLREGKIDCIVSQRPEEQGRLVLSQLYRHLVLGEEPEREITMPFDVYFKENLV